MKPTVLIFFKFYLPGQRAGGPIRTIANLVSRLGDEFNFLIVTSDRDMGDTEPYENIKVNTWTQVGKAKVFYADKSCQTIFGFARIIQETPHDVLYLNSFFCPIFTLRPLLARWLKLIRPVPLILAPKGTFSVGAMNIRGLKKKALLLIFWNLRILSNIVWHASTKDEAEDIRRISQRFPKGFRDDLKISVAVDLAESFDNSNLLKVLANEDLSKEVLRVCFLSRIVEMKNLIYALQVLNNVSAKVLFKIYGPKEDMSYWDQCQEMIDTLPTNISVEYCGNVDHEAVVETISKFDLFFVPSLGENYGHVFIESLAAGVPILVSDRTPWRNLTKDQVGWDISLDDMDGFVDAIEQAALMSSQERLSSKERCISYAYNKIHDSSDLEMNQRLFLDAIRIPTQ